MVYEFLDKNPKAVIFKLNQIKQTEQLAEELHKPVIRKLKKRKVYSWFEDH